MKDVTIKIPRDFRNFNDYVRLRNRLAEDDQLASYLFIMLYHQLAMQATMYGHAGFFKASEVEAFKCSVMVTEEVRKYLMDYFTCAGYLVPHEIYGVKGYWCQGFAEHNYHLDKEYAELPGGNSVLSQMSKIMNRAAEANLGLVQRIPKECWKDFHGLPVSSETMNHALLMIRTIDSITQRTLRKEEDFTPSLVQASLRVMAKYSEAKLAAIFRMWFPRARTEHKHFKLPRTTEQAIENFDELVFILMPAEGWESWVRK